MMVDTLKILQRRCKISELCMTILWILGIVMLIHWNFVGQSGLCKSFIFYQMTCKLFSSIFSNFFIVVYIL